MKKIIAIVFIVILTALVFKNRSESEKITIEDNTKRINHYKATDNQRKQHKSEKIKEKKEEIKEIVKNKKIDVDKKKIIVDEDIKEKVESHLNYVAGGASNIEFDVSEEKELKNGIKVYIGKIKIVGPKRMSSFMAMVDKKTGRVMRTWSKRRMEYPVKTLLKP